nr:MAG TPA: hypothetical protein [Caudoviricetes sp.]
MIALEQMILDLKETVRDNYYFLRRRIDKGNGKKTLGWVLKRDDTDNSLENVDFQVLDKNKEELKNNEGN